MAEQVMIKGQSFKSFFTAFEKLYGESKARELKQQLPPEIGQAIANGTVLPSGWYAVAWYRALHTAAKVVIGDASLADKIGTETTRADLSGIYSSFAKLLSPKNLLRVLSVLFGTYTKGGSLKVQQTGERMLTLYFHYGEPIGMDMWNEIAAACRTMLVLGGEKNVASRWVSGATDLATDSNLEVTY